MNVNATKAGLLVWNRALSIVTPVQRLPDLLYFLQISCLFFLITLFPVLTTAVVGVLYCCIRILVCRVHLASLAG